MRKLIPGLLLSALMLYPFFFTSCANYRSTVNEAAPEKPAYQVYDERVAALGKAVEKRDITVAEAEKKRQEAFREYLDALEKERVNREYRNY